MGPSPRAIRRAIRFVPRYKRTFWSSIIQATNLFGRHLRKVEGVEAHEVRGAEKLQASLAAGHGIMLTPNATSLVTIKTSIHIFFTYLFCPSPLRRCVRWPWCFG